MSSSTIELLSRGYEDKYLIDKPEIFSTLMQDFVGIISNTL
jgi:hypothetical protein